LVSADLLLGAKLLVFGNKYKFPQNPAPVENIRSILAAFHFTFPHFDRCFSPGAEWRARGAKFDFNRPWPPRSLRTNPQRGPQMSSLITFEKWRLTPSPSAVTY
jgi:hypothetical protein